MEAMLFLEWFTRRRLLLLSDFEGIVTTVEYVGGISDFTGELGRLAIGSASRRDEEGVMQVFETGMVLSAVMMQLNINNRFSKKTDAVVFNQKKVADIVYELCLLKMGGKTVLGTEENSGERGGLRGDQDDRTDGTVDG